MIGLDPGGLSGQDANYVADYATALGLTFPIVMDIESSYGAYTFTDKIAPFPLDVIVGADGVIAHVSRDFDIVELQSVIAELLEGE